MESKFGRGFITSIVLICKHFALPPEQAFYGAAGHLEGFEVPAQFRGTEVEARSSWLQTARVFGILFRMDSDHWMKARAVW